MKIDLQNVEHLTSSAISEFWRTIDSQGARKKASDADRGERASVTGGKQMIPFAVLVRDVLLKNGLPGSSVLTQTAL
jgi:hypothetical protein